MGANKPNDLLKAARERRRWTQAELAERIECPTSINISRWENGVTAPNRHYRERLSQVFQLSPTELGLAFESEQAKDPSLPEAIFLYNEPLPGPQELYGREAAKRTLLQRTARKASTSITGARRIGKTWLTHYLRFIAPEHLGSRFRLAYLDAMQATCRTVPGFTAEALKALQISPTEPVTGLQALVAGAQRLQDEQCAPVLCIDEFEYLGDGTGFDLDFFSGLRAMTQTLDLVLITVSKQPLHQVVGTNARGSGFFNVFERVHLKPFTLTEAEQFIREKSLAAGFQPKESDYLWKYGRLDENAKCWEPQRLQLAGKILLEDLEQARKDSQYREIFEEKFKLNEGE